MIRSRMEEYIPRAVSMFLVPMVSDAIVARGEGPPQVSQWVFYTRSVWCVLYANACGHHAKRSGASDE